MGLKDLFGGSEEQRIAIPVDKTPAEFRRLRGPLSRAFTSMLEGSPETGFNLPRFGGPMVAPMTEAEAKALARLRAEGGTRQDLIEQTLAGRFLPGQEGANPYLDAAIRAAQRPTLEGLEETLSRTLPGRFTQAGHFTQPQGSSAFDRAAAIATRGAANALADIATTISLGAYESERGRQQQAIQLSHQEVDTMVKKLQAEALPRLIEDLGIERGLREYEVRTQALMQLLGTLTAASAPNIATIQHAEGSSSRGIIPTLFPRGI